MALTAETRVCAVNGFVVHITWSGDEKARHGGRFRATDSSPGLCRPSRWVRGKAYLAICSPSVPVGRARGFTSGRLCLETPFRARLPSLPVQFSASALPACLSGSTLSHRSVAPRHTPRLYRCSAAYTVLFPICAFHVMFAERGMGNVWNGGGAPLNE